MKTMANKTRKPAYGTKEIKRDLKHDKSMEEIIKEIQSRRPGFTAARCQALILKIDSGEKPTTEDWADKDEAPQAVAPVKAETKQRAKKDTAPKTEKAAPVAKAAKEQLTDEQILDFLEQGYSQNQIAEKLHTRQPEVDLAQQLEQVIALNIRRKEARAAAKAASKTATK